TRWQIPYLFLLEYAQWSYLSALGLKPNMVCGHSLGELIALCCSGIYSPELAWHILDTRAEHVASLEARAGQDFGMLAVHAKHDLVHELLQNYQSVRVANYNTPTQFILGGPKDVLKEIRSSLRKKRIPAVSLSVSLLFHHPKMRILREHSLMRLMALDMQPAATPVLSVCKGVPYPADTPSICTFIADLDENPVRFSECLTKMWQDYGLRTFLEIGPQEVLCGLIVENLPQAQVLSCGRKGHEARGLRELCAKLYALGYLPKSKLVQVQARPKEKIWGEDTLLEDTLLKDKPKTKEQSAKNLPENMDDEAKKLFELLARLSNLPPAAIALELDLRSDLALRSSSFPLLLSEAEKIFNKIPDFEELVQISTVGDLLRLFRGEKLAKEPKEIKVPLPRPAKLCCLEVIEQQVKLVANLGEKPPRTTLGSLALGFLPLNQENYKFLPSLLPDLFLGLPGLISELRLPLELLSYFDDTVGAKLPIKTVKDSGFLASDLAEEGANLSD
ncbi:MAG: acyltransferase domain-containing protein, partial [Desulfovibrio sp.]|nr:acyltransferase domain-containing protein [Desulfovibrio sp.]